MSTLGASPILRLNLSYPKYGSWRADVTLATGAVPSGVVTLTIGDLVLTGTVLRADLDAPGKPHAIITGAPGWEREVTTPLSYESEAGVRLSSVLTDLSRLSGETIEQPTDRTLDLSVGVRASSPGERVLLRDVLSSLRRSGYLEAWRVDPDGVTRFGARVGAAVTVRATPLRRSRDVGLTVYGIDAPLSFLPGNTVEGAEIQRIVIMETSGKLEAEVWTVPSLRAEILRWVATAYPQLAYGYPRTYIVQNVRDGGNLDLVPPPDAPELPELSNVEQWHLGGAVSTPVLGSVVAVMFLDANPARPRVIADGAFPAADLVEFTGGSTDILDPVNAAPAGRVLRYGDTITSPLGGPFVLIPGTPPAPVSKVKA